MKKLLYLFLTVLIVSCNSDDISTIGLGEVSSCPPLVFTSDYTSPWSLPFMGNNDTVPYIPDYYAVYYYFVVNDIQDQYIQINGNYGTARYMSYNVYNADSTSTDYLSTLGSILDKEITPYCDSTNPFSLDNNGGDNSNYTVNIVPDNLGLKNQLTFGTELTSLVVMLRYYVPEDSNGPIAGVELPSIIGKKTDMSGEIDLSFSQLNTPEVGPLEAELTRMAEVVSILSDSIGFWKLDSSSLLANKDNEYLISPTVCSEDQLAIIRFKPPTFNTDTDITQTKNVRYWSLNIGDAATFTYNGIKDKDAIIRDDWCYVVFGRTNNQEVKDKCAELNYNYLEWRVPSDTGIIIYRNLVGDPTFEGWLGNVEEFKLFEPLTVLEKLSQNYIGDSAPRGRRVSIADFLIE